PCSTSAPRWGAGNNPQSPGRPRRRPAAPISATVARVGVTVPLPVPGQPDRQGHRDGQEQAPAGPREQPRASSGLPPTSPRNLDLLWFPCGPSPARPQVNATEIRVAGAESAKPQQLQTRASTTGTGLRNPCVPGVIIPFRQTRRAPEVNPEELRSCDERII